GYVFNSGTALAGDTSTITLPSSASSVNDTYNGSAIYINTGTGAGQLREITDYVGATRVATVDTLFTTAPGASSTYTISPKVVINGDGSGAQAYSVGTGGSISRIISITPGTN